MFQSALAQMVQQLGGQTAQRMVLKLVQHVVMAMCLLEMSAPEQPASVRHLFVLGLLFILR